MSEPVKTRSYNSPLRAERARLTRLAVLTAATDLFLGKGYPKTTLAAVGSSAGVSADTVLHLFGSKMGLLKEVMDTVIGGDAEDVPLLEREGPRALRAEPDQRRQLTMFAFGISQQLERIRPLDDILRSAAAVDAEAAALRADLQLRQRRMAMRATVSWVAANGELLLPEERAAAVVWTLTSPEVHRMYRVDWQWSADDYQGWLRDTLLSTLLGTVTGSGT